MKQYDMILGESGGKDDDLSKAINKGLDEAYNAGIEHAISIVRINMILFKNEDYCNAVISDLTQLKKPTI